MPNNVAQEKNIEVYENVLFFPKLMDDAEISNGQGIRFTTYFFTPKR